MNEETAFVDVVYIFPDGEGYLYSLPRSAVPDPGEDIFLMAKYYTAKTVTLVVSEPNGEIADENDSPYFEVVLEEVAEG